MPGPKITAMLLTGIFVACPIAAGTSEITPDERAKFVEVIFPELHCRAEQIKLLALRSRVEVQQFDALGADITMVGVAESNSRFSGFLRRLDDAGFPREVLKIEPFPNFGPQGTQVRLKITISHKSRNAQPVRMEAVSSVDRAAIPPIDHDVAVLEQFDLNSLTLAFASVAESDEKAFARLVDAAGEQHIVILDSHLGRNWGRVIKITDYSLEVEEIVAEAGEWRLQVSRLTLPVSPNIDLSSCVNGA